MQRLTSNFSVCAKGRGVHERRSSADTACSSLTFLLDCMIGSPVTTACDPGTFTHLAQRRSTLRSCKHDILTKVLATKHCLKTTGSVGTVPQATQVGARVHVILPTIARPSWRWRDPGGKESCRPSPAITVTSIDCVAGYVIHHNHHNPSAGTCAFRHVRSCHWRAAM